MGGRRWEILKLCSLETVCALPPKWGTGMNRMLPSWCRGLGRAAPLPVKHRSLGSGRRDGWKRGAVGREQGGEGTTHPQVGAIGKGLGLSQLGWFWGLKCQGQGWG